MDDREKLVKELLEHFKGNQVYRDGDYITQYMQAVADFILVDRKFIVEPIVKNKGRMLRAGIWWPNINCDQEAQEKTLKRAGIGGGD